MAALVSPALAEGPCENGPAIRVGSLRPITEIEVGKRDERAVARECHVAVRFRERTRMKADAGPTPWLPRQRPGRRDGAARAPERSAAGPVREEHLIS